MIEFQLDTDQAAAGGDFTVSVIGIGGAGANVLDRIALEGMPGAELICMNSDVRALTTSMASRKVQLGRALTQGLGAGGDPELGLEAAVSSSQEIREMLAGRSMVFICTGLGGGTGSGAAPYIAQLAREAGAFVVVFTTMPFGFEGKRRIKQAQESLTALRRHANALVCFDNDRMGELVLPKKGIQEAFETADRVIGQSIRAVTSLVTQPGLIRIGMDDLITALKNTDSRCLFGFGQARGENRAQEALNQALRSPLLDRGEMLSSARNVLVHICGGNTMTLFEIETLMRELSKHVSDDAQILFGAASDPRLNEHLSVTVITSLSRDAGAATAAAEVRSEPAPSFIASATAAAAAARAARPVVEAAPAPAPAAPAEASTLIPVVIATAPVPVAEIVRTPTQAVPVAPLLPNQFSISSGSASMPTLTLSADNIAVAREINRKPARVEPSVPTGPMADTVPLQTAEAPAAPVAPKRTRKTTPVAAPAPEADLFSAPAPVTQPIGPAPVPVAEDEEEEEIGDIHVDIEAQADEDAVELDSVGGSEAEEEVEIVLAENDPGQEEEEDDITAEEEEVMEEDEQEEIAAEDESEEIVDEEEEEEEAPPAPPAPVAVTTPVARPGAPRKFDLRDIIHREPKAPKPAAPAAPPERTMRVEAPVPPPPAQRPAAQRELPDPERITPIRPIPAAVASPFIPARSPAPAPAKPAPAPAPVAAAAPATVSASKRQESFEDRLAPQSRGRFEKTEPTVEEGEDLDVPTFLRKRR